MLTIAMASADQALFERDIDSLLSDLGFVDKKSSRSVSFGDKYPEPWKPKYRGDDPPF